MIVEQMYDVLEQKNGHHYAWQAEKSKEAMILACEDWEPYNGIDGYGGSLDDINKLKCDPSSGCC